MRKMERGVGASNLIPPNANHVALHKKSECAFVKNS